MRWYTNINEEARVAYLLVLTEKIIDQVTEGYNEARKTIDMCWKWLEEKKYDGDDLYTVFDNEDDGGVSMFYEKAVDAENPQQASIWLCINYALEYTIWQAYKFEYGHDNYVPQPIEIVDDDMIHAFTQEISKVNGYQQAWVDYLKQYLLANYPADCNKKITRAEMIELI
ncbi:Imm6 family immunity protein [Thermoactinomyces mirandus]|uniref:Immunity protein Imm6 n=1 Tax=Thermoactinomyces mirandus TaxID=2756294 RepID=A0A7W1XR99_9BACL|nr:Imm6 family immunity protein [Thermoactinomyces mirandus]MBA4601727.1 hypothetical protein [Thermoactinomyces mirandus]